MEGRKFPTVEHMITEDKYTLNLGKVEDMCSPSVLEADAGGL